MNALSSLPAQAIAHSIADAAARWCDADFPPRVRLLAPIAERMNYSEPVVEYALDRLFEAVTYDALAATIESELGGFAFLDGFHARAGRTAAWAAPGGEVCIISSRTTIGVALFPLVFALCAKCRVTVKDREDLLIASFIETLAEERSEFASAARAEAWSAEDDNAPDLSSFDIVVAFGRDETLTQIRRALAPAARFIGFGARASAGYVAREDLRDERAAREMARGAARDVVLYDTEGCLSLHALFVEDGGTIARSKFIAMLETEIAAAEIEFPPAPARAGSAAHGRALAGFREAVRPQANGAPHFLPRSTTPVHVNDPAEALSYLRQHRIPLEGFALSSGRADLVELAANAGAARIARFGELQSPPLAGNHGGRPRIAEFVRWIDKSL
jgi:hypothetical protein